MSDSNQWPKMTKRNKIVKMTYIKDDQVEEEHQNVDDKGSDALQLAHNGLCVLQGEGEMLPLLQHGNSTGCF